MSKQQSSLIVKAAVGVLPVLEAAVLLRRRSPSSMATRPAGKVRQEHNGVTHDLLPSQVTINNLWRLFQVEVWLRDPVEDFFDFPVDGQFPDVDS